MANDIEKKREMVRGIIEKALTGAIFEGFVLYGGKASDGWESGVRVKDEYTTDILIAWLADEDGDLAVDRLVTLIIH